MRARRVAVLMALLAPGIAIGAPIADPPVAIAGGITTVEVTTPANSPSFGEQLIVLSNGNYAIADPYGGVNFPGTVRLYDGTTNAVISTLVGGAGGRLGAGGMVEVGNSNFIVLTPGASGNGAITWVDGRLGSNATVGPSNSMFGYVGGTSQPPTIVVLANGNYVVSNPSWPNGTASSAGFARWAPGNAPATGVISAANSAVGLRTGDRVGSSGIVALTNGNYVIASPEWDWPTFFGPVINAGAATFADGTTGFAGPIADNDGHSLIGVSDFDSVGLQVVALSNGNYVVASPSWNPGGAAVAGAATWRSGTTAVSDQIDASNSLIGTMTGDRVGSPVIALSNGNYVVGASGWDKTPGDNVGAVAWANGATGRIGYLSASTTISGQTTDDLYSVNLTALTNGNYVIGSAYWGPTNAGAATWVNGSGPATGVVTAANSIVGATADDFVGGVTTALPGGAYVVTSQSWNNGPIVDAGAVTWAAGDRATSAVVSPANSIVGSHASDYLGSRQPSRQGPAS